MTNKSTKTSAKKSQKFNEIFGKINDIELSKKILSLLLQYNMKYEEITKVILSHSERAFLDARLITLQEHYDNLKGATKSEIEDFLSSIPEYELNVLKKYI